MQPTGMTPQRCLSAIRTIRNDLEHATGGKDEADRDVALLAEELHALRAALQVDADLRRDPADALRMSRVERTIYLPLIRCLIELLTRVEPMLSADRRPLLREASRKIDVAIA